MDIGREKIIAAAHQRQLLFEQRRDLALEGKHRGGHGTVGLVLGANADSGVGRVGGRLIAEHHVKVVEITGGQQQRVVGRPIIIAGINAQRAAAAQDRFIDLNQAMAVQRVRIQRDVSLPAMAGLLDDAGVGVDGVVEQIAGALIERIDARQHSLNPALSQLRPAPGGPLIIERMVGVGRTVTHDHIVIRKRLDARAADGVTNDPGTIGQRKIAGQGRVLRRRQAVNGGGDFPLVLVFTSAAGEVGRVLQGHLLA